MKISTHNVYKQLRYEFKKIISAVVGSRNNNNNKNENKKSNYICLKAVKMYFTWNSYF